MSQRPSPPQPAAASRREFLSRCGQAAAAVGVATVLPQSAVGQEAEAPAPAGHVGVRTLGKTGLKVSEIGFGGHSWNFKRVPDGSGGLRQVNPEEAKRMITMALERGLNFFDSCSPREEHSVPSEVIKQQKARDRVIVSARLCHKMKGARRDQEIIEEWVEERLKLWQTDYFDILMLTNQEGDTPRSGFWDMSYSLETIDKLKKQGKIRFAGFGCHFAPEWFREAFSQYGKDWDVCSLPYSTRHRMAEDLIPEAKKLGLGIVTIKAFARGALFDHRQLEGADAGLARDLIAFVLENAQVDCCICGMHSEAQVAENLSAAWTKLTPEARQRLDTLAQSPARTLGWLENAWVRPTA